jgi:LacI family transcriptional regulator
MKRTINEIADMAKVAKSTVSKALNGHKGVSEEKRREILALAARYNYEPSASAQALASSRTGSIGLLVPYEPGYSLSGSYWSAIVTSVARAASARNHSLTILSPRAGDDCAAPVEAAIRRRHVDGLIVGAELLEPAVLERLSEEGLPFVLLGRNARIAHHCVDVDNFGGSERLVSHLLGAGYRKIICVSGPDTFLYTRERLDGYHSALDKAGVFWSAAACSGYDSQAARAAVAKLLLSHPEADALYVTAGGGFFLDCLAALKSSGRPLDRFGLAVFDDSRAFDLLAIPPVCAVRQPYAEIGSTAVEMLFAFINGESPDFDERILDVELIVR